MSKMARLKEKIGAMIMIGVRGEELSQEEKSIIRDHSFGGFILFAHNCRASGQIVSLCRALWHTGKEAPPFIGIDQEGGRVHRLPPPFTHFPAADLIGRRRNPRLAYQAGRATAAELALIGINLNFAPVLDVNSNPKNPIIGDRSFGSDPELVIAMASAWTQGLCDGRVIPCGKHFPGHGDTEQDSHLDLPVVEKSLNDLKQIELPPFVHFCRQQIEALMTAHVLFRSLDAELPATLSHKITTGILREQLAYDGVVFGDDMEMRAISDTYEPAQAALLGVQAGLDVLLYCHDLSKAVDAYDLLCREAERNHELRERVEESAGRIRKLKQCFLKSFAGVAEGELTKQLARLDHQRIVDAIHGNL